MTHLLQRAFQYDKWNIGVSLQSREELLAGKALGPVAWLPETKADFRADPFALRAGGSLHVFYEEFNHHRGPGVIKVFSWNGRDVSVPERVTFGENYACHQSYPYVFQSGNDFYMIPELHELKKIEIFRAESFPFRWRRLATIAQGEAFVDSSLYHDGGQWRLISSRAHEVGKAFVYSAPALPGPWTPHPLNPIAVDADGTRGAGRIFTCGGKIYRPTQRCGSEYGAGVRMNEISVSDAGFRQEALFVLEPREPYVSGLHNLDFVGDVVIVDGKRKRYSLLAPARKTLDEIRIRLFPSGMNGAGETGS